MEYMKSHQGGYSRYENISGIFCNGIGSKDIFSTFQLGAYMFAPEL